nr:hypothetical protein [Ferrimicrobium acidiphilum]
MDSDSGKLGTYRMKYVAKRANDDGVDVYVKTCKDIIERVCSVAGIPANMKSMAMGVAQRVAPVRPATMPVVAAYCIVYADRMSSAGSFSSKKLMKAIRAMGHRIKWRSVVQLALAFPVPPKTVNIDAMIWSTIAGLRSTRELPTRYWLDLASNSKHILGLISDYRDGADPSTIAGLCVYLAEATIATKESRKRYFTQDDVTEFTRVSVYALRDLLGRIRIEKPSGIDSVIGTDGMVLEQAKIPQARV